MEEIQNKPSSATTPKMAFIFGILVGVAVFILIGFMVLAIPRGGGKFLTANDEKKDQVKQEQPTPQANPQPTGMEAKIIGQVGTFDEVSEPICKRNGKPVVLMFSTSWCPHCQWARPLFQAAVKNYVKSGKIVAHDWELDTNDDTLTTAKETAVPQEDKDLYEKYNPSGSIPTFIFGCKYYRVGTGNERSNNTAAEQKEFEDLIDKLLK